MTMILPSSLRQPSKKDYLDALSNEHKWPFWLRATVINRYRKLMRPVAQMVERHPVGLKTDAAVGSSPTRARKRYRAKPLKQHSQKKNFIVLMASWMIVRWKSAGKGRPSRKKDYQRTKRKMVLWLKGNKHNGGQHVQL